MLNIACYISLFRLCSAPVVFYLMMHQAWWQAGVVFLLAALSDLLDGYVARRYNMISQIGQFLDPLADKVLLLAVMYGVILVYPLALWQQSIIYFLIFKECVLLLGAFVLITKYSYFIEPSVLSRMASLVEFMFLAAALSASFFGGPTLGMAMSASLVLSAFLTCWLLVRYVGLLWCKFAR